MFQFNTSFGLPRLGYIFYFIDFLSHIPLFSLFSPKHITRRSVAYIDKLFVYNVNLLNMLFAAQHCGINCKRASFCA